MAHNGGRSQLNVSLTLVYEFPFINHCKLLESWGGNDNWPLHTNENGYLISNPSPWLAGSIHVPNPAEYSGNWIIDWQGTGKCTLASSFGIPPTVIEDTGGWVVGPDLTIFGTNIRVTFKLTENTRGLAFYMIEGPSISNIRIYRADHESLQAQGEIFTPLWIEKLRELNFGLIRFQDWQFVNHMNQAGWKYRAKVDDISYVAPKWHPDIQVGDISGTNTKTCGAATDTPGTWTDLEMFQGRNLTANTGASTINVNGRGAKPLLTVYTDPLTPGYLTANGLCTFMYSAGVDSVFAWPPSLVTGINSGVPDEVMIALCNKLKCNGWVTFPFWGSTEFFEQRALMWKNQLNPSLYMYTEFSNEVWNPSYEQSWMAALLGSVVLGLIGDSGRNVLGWHAKRFLDIANAVQTSFGAATNYRLLLGARINVNPIYTFQPYLFEAQDLGLSFPNRPIDRAYAILLQNYPSGPNVSQFYGGGIAQSLLDAADNYATGNPALMTSALEYVDNDIRNGVGGDATLARCISEYWPLWATQAATYGVKVQEYESQLAARWPIEAECVAAGIPISYSAKIDALLVGYDFSQYAENFIRDRYAAFIANAGFEFPSQFWLSYGFPLGGDLAGHGFLIRGSIYEKPNRMYDAIVAFNAQPSATTVAVKAGVGGSKKKKRRLLSYEPLPSPPEFKQPIDRATPVESLDVNYAKTQADELARQIIEGRREISRIKTQMRLSTSGEALQAMEREIGAIEKHLIQTKRDAEDMLLLTLLM